MDKLMDVEALYKEDPKLKNEEVQMIMTWCGQQRHFPNVPELQAALALHACFYSVEQAKSCLENFYTIRGMCPELFSSLNPENDAGLKLAIDVNLLAVLPEKTKEGYTIILTKLMDTNPDIYNPQIGIKIFDMVALHHINVNGPANGIALVMDMKGGVFGHVTKLNLGEFKKFMVYLQTAMPIRLMAIHFINVVPFMDKLMALVKPFINKDMYDKLIIHTNNNNLDKYIPNNFLPVDYGGKAEPLHVLFEKYKTNLYENRWFFDYQQSMVADEAKRIGPRKNADSLFGFDGTFKKLSVD